MRNLFLICLCLYLMINLHSYRWPMSNTQVQDTFHSAFGPRNLDNQGGLNYDFHRGMDLGATLNASVHASRGGYYHKVPDNGNTGPGNWVWLDHGNGNRTYYMHLNSFVSTLQEGQNVTEGTTIGYAGNTGTSNVHLHFALVYYFDGVQHYLHPLYEMPYNDNSDVEIEMVTTEEDDFSFRATISNSELDLNKIIITLSWVELGTYYTTQSYVIDYSTKENIPTESENHTILTSIDDNTDWTLYVTPESFSSINDQEVVFRITETAPDDALEVYNLDIWAINATYEEYEILFTHNDFDPAFNYEDSSFFNKDFLGINYPNPFNPTTTISYNLGDAISNPKIDIFNIKGQIVNSFDLEEREGENQIVWNGTDKNEDKVSSGVYFYRLINDNKSIQTKKMLMLK